MREFVLGAYETDLRPGELIVAVLVPRQPGTAVYRKVVFSERPVVGVALAETGQGWRLVIGAVAMTPEILEVRRLDEIDPRAIAESLDVLADLGGSEEYKTHLTAVTIGRCVAAAGRQDP